VRHSTKVGTPINPLTGVFLLLTRRRKEFIIYPVNPTNKLTAMPITVYTVLDFPEDKFLQNKQSRCSYPWEKTSVGGGFLVPFSDLGKKKSVPTVPNSLKEKGIIYEYAKLPAGYLFKRIS